MTDTSNWLTKPDAAHRIGVSTKTIETFAKEGKLKQKPRERPGKPPIVVYDPVGVEKLRQARTAEIVPWSASDPINKATIVKDLAQVLAPIVPGSKRPVSQVPAVPVEQLAYDDESKPMLYWALFNRLQLAKGQLYVTLPQATLVTGLPLSLIKRLIREGKMPALKTGRGWRIRNRDLYEIDATLAVENAFLSASQPPHAPDCICAECVPLSEKI